MTFPWTFRKRIDTTCRMFIIRLIREPMTSRVSNRLSCGISRSGRTANSIVPRIMSNSLARAAATESDRVWRAALTFTSNVRLTISLFDSVWRLLLYFSFPRSTIIKFLFFSPSSFQVPPEDITISKRMLNVTVDTIPDVVECDAKARPKPSFRWFREGSTDITIMEGHVFDLKIQVPRRSNGTYYCEASNRHGILNISMVLNVQCTFPSQFLDIFNWINSLWREFFTIEQFPPKVGQKNKITSIIQSSLFFVSQLHLQKIRICFFEQIFAHGDSFYKKIFIVLKQRKTREF